MACILEQAFIFIIYQQQDVHLHHSQPWLMMLNWDIMKGFLLEGNSGVQKLG